MASLAPSGQFTFSPSPTHNKKVVQVWVGEPLGLPPHPSGLTASHLPLKGKALKTRSSAFPFRGRCPRRGRMRYPCFELGMLARQTQAREWNRASSNFRKPRAQWPGGNLECHSDFARRKFRLHFQACVSYGHEVPVGRVPRRSFGDFPIAGKVTRRPQAAKLPAKTSRIGAPSRRALQKEETTLTAGAAKLPADGKESSPTLYIIRKPPPVARRRTPKAAIFDKTPLA